MVDKKNQEYIHDINSTIMALKGAIELIEKEWKKDIQLINTILPLASEKIVELEKSINQYHS